MITVVKLKTIAAIKGDLKLSGRTQTETQERQTFWPKVCDWEVGRDRKPKRTGTARSKAIRKAHNIRTKEE